MDQKALFGSAYWRTSNQGCGWFVGGSNKFGDFGWQNSLYSSKGANGSQFGEPIAPAPTISVDKVNKTINFDFPSASLGRPDTLKGIKFYVTTWDLDGLSSTYRPLQAETGPWNFSGGTDQDPLIWDDLPLLTLDN